jgi:hypothetical protein
MKSISWLRASSARVFVTSSRVIKNNRLRYVTGVKFFRFETITPRALFSQEMRLCHHHQDSLWRTGGAYS